MPEPTSPLVASGKVLQMLRKGYSIYKDHKLDKALQEVEQGGYTVDDLLKTDHRFASFVRFLRAYEVCSSNAMYSTLTQFLLNGLKSEEVDKRPDIFQSVLSKLGELTEMEVKILGRMQQLNMWGEDGPKGFEISLALDEWVEEAFSIDQAAARGVVSGMQRSGFVQVKPATWAGEKLNYRLTGLAKYLLDLVYYKSQL